MSQLKLMGILDPISHLFPACLQAGFRSWKSSFLIREAYYTQFRGHRVTSVVFLRSEGDEMPKIAVVVLRSEGDEMPKIAVVVLRSEGDEILNTPV